MQTKSSDTVRFISPHFRLYRLCFHLHPYHLICYPIIRASLMSSNRIGHLLIYYTRISLICAPPISSLILSCHLFNSLFSSLPISADLVTYLLLSPVAASSVISYPIDASHDRSTSQYSYLSPFPFPFIFQRMSSTTISSHLIASNIISHLLSYHII